MVRTKIIDTQIAHRFLILHIIVLISFQFVGCTSDRISPEKKANEYCEKMIDCINENNREELKEMLCEITKKDENVDAEIEEFFFLF